VNAVRHIGIDVGGTFTDVVIADADGVVGSRKLPTSGALDFAQLFAATGPGPIEEICYSTTVALNGLLSGKLPSIGFIVTAGFRDLLETARLPPAAGTVPPAPLPRRLVALEQVREIDARSDAGGREVRPIDGDQVAAIARDFSAAGIEVVGVALLHSYLNPAHERAIEAVFATHAPAIEVVLSSTVLPEQSEYERALATALNASLIPLLRAHLDALRLRAPSERLWLMQAQGGLAAEQAVRRTPVATALAGPAAAVVGMSWLAAQSGYRDLVTLDIGGTSTDVALIADGRCASSMQGSVAGFPLRTPLLDVLSIGAGGGSIAYAAPDGRWHVGPDSAGAEPGPACYGRGGTMPTLTDAELVLGRLPAALLGGELPLDRARAVAVLAALGHSRGLDARATARGILAIASHAMCGAIRQVAVRRGRDPAAHALFAMGGAGPLHAAELAELLGIGTVVVPPQPGLAAAFGALVADVVRDFVHPVGILHVALDLAMLERALSALEDTGQRWLDASGAAFVSRVLERKLDLRYAGMTHTTTVTCPAAGTPAALLAATIERFHDEFERLSGRSWRDREAIEVVNLRVTVRGCRVPLRVSDEARAARAAGIPQAERAVDFLGRPVAVTSAVFVRDTLEAGQQIRGPAVIEQHESTTLIPPGWRATGDALGNLVLERTSGGPT
jgi:N-methylhydantoinase A